MLHFYKRISCGCWNKDLVKYLIGTRIMFQCNRKNLRAGDPWPWLELSV
jgi:hypothetical protein